MAADQVQILQCAAQHLRAGHDHVHPLHVAGGMDQFGLRRTAHRRHHFIQRLTCADSAIKVAQAHFRFAGRDRQFLAAQQPAENNAILSHQRVIAQKNGCVGRLGHFKVTALDRWAARLLGGGQFLALHIHADTEQLAQEHDDEDRPDDAEWIRDGIGQRRIVPRLVAGSVRLSLFAQGLLTGGEARRGGKSAGIHTRRRVVRKPGDTHNHSRHQRAKHEHRHRQHIEPQSLGTQ